MLLLGLAVGRAGAAVQSECIDEPIFEGRVCLYEANPRGERTVMLVHGLGGRALFDWEHLIPVLARQYHVVALDLPGVRAAARPVGSYATSRYARLLRYVADRYASKPFSLVGHSMGAAIALRYAEMYPDGLDRLVLANTAGVLHGLALSKYIAGGWARRHGFPGAADFVERLTAKTLEEFERLPGQWQDWAADEWIDDETLPERTRERAAVALSREDFSKAVYTVTTPTLVVWGDADPVAPLRTGIVLSRHMPNARLEVLDDVGHATMREAPDRFNRLVTGFLAGPPPAPHGRAEKAAIDSERVGRCHSRSGMTFRGPYRRIELRNCDDVTIRDATVGSLFVYESRVKIVDSRVEARDMALVATGASIRATASRFDGGIAIAASRSRFDLAGVTLQGTEAAIRADRTSKFIFSVCRLADPARVEYLHGFRVLTREAL